MSENRKGEEGFPPFRSGRIFSIGAQWFFATREGDRGPYPTRESAQEHLDAYVAAVLEAHPQLKKA